MKVDISGLDPVILLESLDAAQAALMEAEAQVESRVFKGLFEDWAKSVAALQARVVDAVEEESVR